MDPVIIPLNLYTNFHTYSSYISQPANGVEYGNSNGGEFVGQFYAINPAIGTIPPGMDIFCADSTVRVIYDQFNIANNRCVRFLAWIEPIVYTTPLYIMKKGDATYISFQHDIPPGYQDADPPRVYVLVDPRTGLSHIPGNVPNFRIIDNTPQFLFSGNMGRCIPDPNGTSLSSCLMMSVKNITKPRPILNTFPSLLQKLEEQARGKDFGPSIGITVCLSAILFAALLWVIFSEKRKKRK